ncbi:hypothetical protein MRI28_07145 [Nocardiopsis dassonvillei]|uniref:hypothetical protein n=1 Tax=Nocardiopsis dassonvillei TaxID=2014 RepID=UPI00200F2ECA|nr:hypothetical protein [Nocardiopsis dassonvillei]MCK9869430.1 hypothetical protein [Nocardiopsis dassonvillei]
MPLSLPLPAHPSSSTLLLDRVRAQDPDRLQRARELLDAVEARLALRHRARGRLMSDLAERFASSDLPEAYLPWFWDTVGHRLVEPDRKRAGSAFSRAREAEAAHALPVDPHHTVENALLFARHGALAAKESGAHRARLAALLPPREAHREFLRFLDSWTAGGAPVPAGLPSRLRASAGAAGLGRAEEARALGRVLAASGGREVPVSVLEAADRVFAEAPPSEEDRPGLAVLFPASITDGSPWLRLLETTGVAEDMVQGRLIPKGGYGAWLSRYFFMYGYRWVGQGVTEQRMPEELYALLGRIAPRIREEKAPVRLYEGRYRHGRVDGELVRACESHGIGVDLPAGARRPLRGPRNTEGGTRPHPRFLEQLNAEVERARGGLLETAGRGLTELDACLSHEVMRNLDEVEEILDGLDLAAPLARTLRFGVPGEYGWRAFEEAVAEIGARDGGVRGMTSTWPVLTVYGRDAAVAVDHRERRGSCAFTLPEDADEHTVHFVGGDFQVSWTTSGKSDGYRSQRALWCSAPEDVFDTASPPALFDHGTAHSYDLGLVLASPDGGRYDRNGVLRPGDRRGVTQVHDHLGDGTRVWSNTHEGAGGFSEVDPVTGVSGDPACPDFLTPDPRLGYADHLDTRPHLVGLPEGVDGSPLGSADGLAGFRVVWTGPGAEGVRKAQRALEGTDGRRAPLPDHPGLTYWGVLRMPGGTAEGLLAYRWQAGHTVVQCRDADDHSLLWETWAYPKARLRNHEDNGLLPLVPPPAFWHFLSPRDPDASRALRGVDEATARRLIEAAVYAPGAEDPSSPEALLASSARTSPVRAAAVRGALSRLLPEVTDEALVDGTGGVVWAVLWAAELRLRREEMSQRTALVRADTLPVPVAEATDADLEKALAGLFDSSETGFHSSSRDLAATVTALNADGARLRGGIDERVRRLSRRRALVALLRVWAEQPFAERGTAWVRGLATGASLAPLLAAGRAVIVEPPSPPAGGRGRTARHWSGRYLPERRYAYVRAESAPAPEGAEEQDPVRIERDEAARLRRFLEVLDQRGPVVFGPEAAAAFRASTRVSGATAEFVLSGGFGRPGAAPEKGAARAEYQGTGAGLSAEQRRGMLVAAVPDDPADLWEPGGAVAAAERMARVWVELLGAQPTRAERAAAKAGSEVPDLFAADLAMDPSWTGLLADPSGEGHAAADQPRHLVQNSWGSLEVRRDDTRERIHGVGALALPFRDPATVLSWAALQLPVGHPAAAGAARLHARLSAGLRRPGSCVPLSFDVPAPAVRAWAERVGAVPVRVGAQRALEPGSAERPLYSDGVLVLHEPRMDRPVVPVLLTAGLFDPAAVERTVEALAGLDLRDTVREVRRAAALYGGLARTVARAADTPVPAGGFEADPRLSVPDLVEEVAGRLDVDADAAALYLQLLTLSRPTDRNVRRWNGWAPAHHRRTAARLLETGAVEQGRRSRAGRTLFVPGGWTELKAPHLPLETAKLGSHLVRARIDKQIEGPLNGVWPVAPAHEMFARAWRERGPA